MTPTSNVNQLVFVVISGQQADGLLQSLVQERFYFTRLNNTGTLFQEETVCIMVGLNSSRALSLFGLIAETCKPHPEYLPVQINPPVGFQPLPMMEARVGGALVYMLEVEQFIQF